jgi:hypothetical protein
MVLKSFYQWLTLHDYESAKDEGTDRIIKRYSRGNTSIQNGWYVTEDELKELSAKGDRAMTFLEGRLPA